MTTTEKTSEFQIGDEIEFTRAVRLMPKERGIRSLHIRTGSRGTIVDMLDYDPILPTSPTFVYSIELLDSGKTVNNVSSTVFGFRIFKKVSK